MRGCMHAHNAPGRVDAGSEQGRFQRYLLDGEFEDGKLAAGKRALDSGEVYMVDSSARDPKAKEKRINGWLGKRRTL